MKRYTKKNSVASRVSYSYVDKRDYINGNILTIVGELEDMLEANGFADSNNWMEDLKALFTAVTGMQGETVVATADPEPVVEEKPKKRAKKEKPVESAPVVEVKAEEPVEAKEEVVEEVVEAPVAEPQEQPVEEITAEEEPEVVVQKEEEPVADLFAEEKKEPSIDWSLFGSDEK